MLTSSHNESTFSRILKNHEKKKTYKENSYITYKRLYTH